jgi:hypothetical protein
LNQLLVPRKGHGLLEGFANGDHHVLTGEMRIHNALLIGICWVSTLKNAGLG